MFSLKDDILQLKVLRSGAGFSNGCCESGLSRRVGVYNIRCSRRSGFESQRARGQVRRPRLTGIFSPVANCRKSPHRTSEQVRTIVTGPEIPELARKSASERVFAASKPSQSSDAHCNPRDAAIAQCLRSQAKRTAIAYWPGEAKRAAIAPEPAQAKLSAPPSYKSQLKPSPSSREHHIGSR